ncbi:MAG: DUF2877 domain-containing protein [Eubacteriales bacterium]|nr:DUF2877 domain-containing protein [Eubacteriales bacterium]
MNNKFKINDIKIEQLSLDTYDLIKEIKKNKFKQIKIHSIFKNALNIILDEEKNIFLSFINSKTTIEPRSICTSINDFLEINVKENDEIRDLKLQLKDNIKLTDLSLTNNLQNYFIREYTNTKNNSKESIYLKRIKNNIKESLIFIKNNIIEIASKEEYSDSLLPLISSELKQNYYTNFIKDRIIKLDEQTIKIFNLLFNEDKELSNCDYKIFSSLGKNIAGLGIGLTPSSDDFLKGYISALYFIESLIILGKNTKPTTDYHTYKISNNLLKKINTTNLSTSFLHNAKLGLFSSDIIKLYIHICNLSLNNIKKDIEKISSFGATSGIDTLTGIYYSLNKNFREVYKW